MYKLGLEKAEEPEIKLPTSAGSWENQESCRKKTTIFALLTMPKPLTVWISPGIQEMQAPGAQTAWMFCEGAAVLVN